jgi:hypothetical protein|tara:strand:+ start:187 stop:399 length:213 start_codon:yes stop_codon:yes gene_type:complete
MEESYKLITRREGNEYSFKIKCGKKTIEPLHLPDRFCRSLGSVLSQSIRLLASDSRMNGLEFSISGENLK